MNTILIVEDNQDNMDLAREILEDVGYKIFGAVTAEEGLAILTRGISVDLILMDVSLPGTNGYDATRALKAQSRFAQIPVIILTAHAMREDQERAYEAGCNDFLTKPLDEDALVSMVEKQITRSGE